MREDATFGLAAKIWWAFTWRAVLLAVSVNFVIGFVLGFIGRAANINLLYISLVCGLCFGIYASIFILKRMMVKGFGPYKLAVVRDDNARG